jgi:hypothetical protein
MFKELLLSMAAGWSVKVGVLRTNMIKHGMKFGVNLTVKKIRIILSL